MILYDTPYDEAARIMLQEYEKVKYQINKTGKEAWKALKKEKNAFKKINVINFTLPESKNTYTICSKPGNSPDEILRHVYLKVNGNDRKKKIFYLGQNHKKDYETNEWVLQVYTGHFMSRFRERSGFDNIGSDELMMVFLETTGKKGLPIPARLVNPAVDDEDQFGIICEQGLIFSKIQEIIINGINVQINENRTFVGKEDLFFKQAMTLLSTDYIEKRIRLDMAKKEGASPEKLLEIIQSGFFEPTP